MVAGLPPKVVQERLGHSSITMTYDRYGHLFPRGDDAAGDRRGRKCCSLTGIAVCLRDISRDIMEKISIKSMIIGGLKIRVSVVRSRPWAPAFIKD